MGKIKGIFGPGLVTTMSMSMSMCIGVQDKQEKLHNLYTFKIINSTTFKLAVVSKAMCCNLDNNINASQHPHNNAKSDTNVVDVPGSYGIFLSC